MRIWMFGSSIFGKSVFGKTKSNCQTKRKPRTKKHILFRLICECYFIRALRLKYYCEYRIYIFGLLSRIAILVCILSIFSFVCEIFLFSFIRAICHPHTHWLSVALNIYKRDCGHISMWFQGLSRICASVKSFCSIAICASASNRFVKKTAIKTKWKVENAKTHWTLPSPHPPLFSYIDEGPS